VNDNNRAIKMTNRSTEVKAIYGCMWLVNKFKNRL